LIWISMDMAMGGMDMAGYRMIPSGIGLMMPADRPWQPVEFAFVFAMWVVMMAAMMTPSAAPMILMYARAGQFIKTRTAPLAATVCFSGGYFLVWVAFALLATMAQWGLERAALLDSAMTSTSNVLGAVVFVAVGGYQWTRLKDRCLAQCQQPFAFLVRQGAFRPNAPGSLMLGLRHGAYCLGCCWALMALLFVGGVMNMLWIVALALLILVEKVTPFGRQFAAVAGTVLIAAGAWLSGLF
jgi:predicted metal-binding membrane protein